MARSVRLTKGMLESMSLAINALSDLMAGEKPQRPDDIPLDGKGHAEFVKNLGRAQDWISQEEYRRSDDFKVRQDRQKAYDRGGG